MTSTASKPEKVGEILPHVPGVDRREIPRDHSVTKEQELDHFIALANEARRDYEDAGAEYAKYVTLEAEKEAYRPEALHEATLRIMAEQKVAATNAEKLARIDAGYLDHLEDQRNTVALKNAACTRMHSAKLRAETAVAAVKAIGGWV